MTTPNRSTATLAHREYVRALLAAEDLTPREIDLIVRLDDAADEIDELQQELTEYEQAVIA
ncbi:MAG: hypothetical protein FHK80_00450 [Azoarcus sp. PHD]|nr:MAG: hypothetical protein FHK80_00450 [Azoarcus sp. PHD]